MPHFAFTPEQGPDSVLDFLNHPTVTASGGTVVVNTRTEGYLLNCDNENTWSASPSIATGRIENASVMFYGVYIQMDADTHLDGRGVTHMERCNLQRGTMPLTQRQHQDRVEELQRQQRAEADRRRADTVRAYMEGARTNPAIQNIRPLTPGEVQEASRDGQEVHTLTHEPVVFTNRINGNPWRYIGADTVVIPEGIWTVDAPIAEPAIPTPNPEELSAYTQRYNEAMQEWMQSNEVVEPSVQPSRVTMGGLRGQIYGRAPISWSTDGVRDDYERILEMMIDTPRDQGLSPTEATTWLANSPF